MKSGSRRSATTTGYLTQAFNSTASVIILAARLQCVFCRSGLRSIGGSAGGGNVVITLLVMDPKIQIVISKIFQIDCQVHTKSACDNYGKSEDTTHDVAVDLGYPLQIKG